MENFMLCSVFGFISIFYLSKSNILWKCIQWEMSRFLSNLWILWMLWIGCLFICLFPSLILYIFRSGNKSSISKPSNMGILEIISGDIKLTLYLSYHSYATLTCIYFASLFVCLCFFRVSYHSYLLGWVLIQVCIIVHCSDQTIQFRCWYLLFSKYIVVTLGKTTTRLISNQCIFLSMKSWF